MKIKDTDISVLKTEVMTAITNAFKIAGYNVPPPKDLAEIVTLTVNDLQKYYRHNTLDDIKRVFDLGAHREYGDYTVLSPAEFYTWMKKYNGTVINVQPVNEEPPSVQRKDTAQDGRNLVNTCYESYRRFHQCYFSVSLILEILAKEGVYSPTDWEKADAEVRAEGVLTAEYLKKHDAFEVLSTYISKNKNHKATELLLHDFFDMKISENQLKIF